MNHINLPKNPDVAGKLVEAQAASEKAKIDRGIIGMLIGSRESVPYNTAFLVVVACLAAVIWMLVFGDGFAANKDSIAVLTPILTLFGGYLFGRHSKD